MAKRASQAKPRPSAAPRVLPWWVLFFGGMLCGIVLIGVVLMKQWLPQLAEPPPTLTPPAAPVAAADSARRQYDFYNVLPEMEVVVPDEEVRSASAAEVPAPSPAGTQRYLLQAGSFRAVDDAEALKARLALMGLRPSIQAVTINGAEYFRVRVGPFADLREVDIAKRTLEGNGIQAIALRESAP